jgi:RND family efflux transporter MFP subunit
MKALPLQKRTLALMAVLVPLLGLFVYVALRSGPLTPVSIVLTSVEKRSLSPELFGIGTVEARYAYRVGPTISGRVKRLDVHVGDKVKAGQILGEMDPVDLNERIRAQQAALKHTKAQLDEAQARKDYTQAEALRYKRLYESSSTSAELLAAKEQELRLAQAGFNATQSELSRVQAELDALHAQQHNLLLRAPANGLIVARDVEPGTTAVPGQTVVELIDPQSLWVNVRFDQIRAQGLAADLRAKVTLRSQGDRLLTGTVLRVEPLADEITEETLAKVVLDKIPTPLPPVGELAEITVELPSIAPGPVIPNAAIHHVDGEAGVWQVVDDELHYTPISMGIADLEGYVQIKQGLNPGDQIVVYSENPIHAQSNFKVVEHIPGMPQ